jgi:hypothetical protein
MAWLGVPAPEQLSTTGIILVSSFVGASVVKACVLINEADDNKIAPKAEDLKDLLHKRKARCALLRSK